MLFATQGTGTTYAFQGGILTTPSHQNALGGPKGLGKIPGAQLTSLVITRAEKINSKYIVINGASGNPLAIPSRSW